MTPNEQLIQMTQNGVAITGVQDGDVMACGGISFIDNNDGVVWLRVSKKCKSNPINWARTIKETFKLMVESCVGLNIYTYVIDGFERGDRMAKSIGLKKTHIKYIHNGNVYYKYTVK